MYRLLLLRNEKGINGNTKNKTIKNLEKTVIEYKRTKRTESSSEFCKYEMKPKEKSIKLTGFIPSDKEGRLELYLEIFKCNNIPGIEKLEKFLIPLVSSLRYYHEYYVKNYQVGSESSIKERKNYEFNALIASTIAALTLTYLNINLYESNKSNEGHVKVDLKYKQRLELRDKLHPERIFKFMKNDDDKSQYKRETQILAEFKNVLTVNSNIMQILKLTDDDEYQNISTMHHYLWDQAFNRIIFNLKQRQYRNHYRMKKVKEDSDNIDIKDVFRRLFKIKNIDENLFEEYLGFLEKKYEIVKNLVLNSALNDDMLLSLRPGSQRGFKWNGIKKKINHYLISKILLF